MADAPLSRRCTSCHAELAENSRYCSICGTPAGGAATPTAAYERQAPPSTPKSGLPGERFAPGRLIADRFRIVTALGKGGMGEVFRADDLALGQSVALKFLPAGLARDPDRLARLRGEVKAARQVAHPNVCRVYDLGQYNLGPFDQGRADGQCFLCMEYIDGQNLAALLAQVRRLPEERGVEIARQLCLGLGAIHDRGLLHRDLKPANVMLDGRGQVRITDFGLAVPAEQVTQAEATDGTPAYQSPEQLAGREVTVRSDVFALGLILYELFTGKPAFAATSRAALAKSHAEDPPSKPSTHVSGLNPAVEEAILKCLEKDPRDRPRSAYEVLAALPGGDPLAAALAAGQTPSPAVVADAPIEGTLHPLVALPLLVATLVGLAIFLLLDPRPQLWEMVPSQLAPRDLAARAQEKIREFGYTEPPRDAIYGLGDSGLVLNLLQVLEPRVHRWKMLRTGQPPAMFFWYCQSQEWLVPHNEHPPGPTLFTGIATANNPPEGPPGTIRVCLDLKGRLIEFHVEGRKPPAEGPPLPPPQLDWPALLDEAGLARIEPSTDFHPDWTPPQFVEERLAWQGVYADCPEIPVRAEAGLRGGRLVFFHAAPVTGRKLDHRLFTRDSSRLFENNSLNSTIIATIEVLTWIVGAALAWHNVRLGRANVRGTVILSGFSIGTALVAWALSTHHVPNYWAEMGLLADQLGYAAWSAAQVALGYLAMEPYVRRRWPWRVVGWNRILAGRWRDPLVGRDVLVGSLAAIGASLATMLGSLAVVWLDRPMVAPHVTFNVLFTAGPAFGIAAIAHFVTLPALATFLIFFLLYLVTRREWLAAALYFVILLAPAFTSSASRDIFIAVNAVTLALTVGVILRFGLLAYTAMGFVLLILEIAPITRDLSAWYAPGGLVYVAAIAALAVFGFAVASGGQWLAWVGHVTGEAAERRQPAV